MTNVLSNAVMTTLICE